MMFPSALMVLGAMLTFSPAAHGLGKTVNGHNSCVFESYKCGYSLNGVEYGYVNDELTAAVNLTEVVPPLNTIQLLNVLYRCIDTNGAIAANSYCISGCMSEGGSTVNDMCAM